ncbi:MAG: hypothetical protein WC595_04920 [Candidatus Nanoarchaeia archaeon]
MIKRFFLGFSLLSALGLASLNSSVEDRFEEQYYEQFTPHFRVERYKLKEKKKRPLPKPRIPDQPDVRYASLEEDAAPDLASLTAAQETLKTAGLDNEDYGNAGKAILEYCQRMEEALPSEQQGELRQAFGKLFLNLDLYLGSIRELEKGNPNRYFHCNPHPDDNAATEQLKQNCGMELSDAIETSCAYTALQHYACDTGTVQDTTIFMYAQLILSQNGEELSFHLAPCFQTREATQQLLTLKGWDYTLTSRLLGYLRDEE